MPLGSEQAPASQVEMRPIRLPLVNTMAPASTTAAPPAMANMRVGTPEANSMPPRIASSTSAVPRS